MRSPRTKYVKKFVSEFGTGEIIDEEVDGVVGQRNDVHDLVLGRVCIYVFLKDDGEDDEDGVREAEEEKATGDAHDDDDSLLLKATTTDSQFRLNLVERVRNG